MSYQVISAHRMCLAQVLKVENAKKRKGGLQISQNMFRHTVS